MVLANAFTFYEGEASASRPIEFGGLVTLNAQATIYANTLFGIWQTPLELLGGHYAVALAIPFVGVEVEGLVTPPIGPAVKRRDTASGLGDITLYPFMLGWSQGDLKYDVRLGIYAPTGEYDAGQLANVGRNYWTFEPAVSVSWLSTKIGTEVTVFAGLDFNTENDDTQYQSGTSFHLEGTVAQHLPLLGGFAGVGANAFYYDQITGDSGAGAQLGDFAGHTAGVGPVVSYARKIGQADFAAEVKWLPELSVDKRLRGDIVWFKVGLVF